MRLSKIVATVGPASKSPEMLKSLIEAGVNVFRINFSHALHDELPATIATIRELSETLKRPVGILGDLQGPKFRTGILPDHKPVELKNGAHIEFVASKDQVGSAECLTTPNFEVIEALTKGQEILLADGAFRLVVTEKVSPTHLKCDVITGGLLGEKKGINIPGLKLNIPALTEKDKVDARLAMKLGLDFIAMSFVQTAADIVELKTFISDNEEFLPESAIMPWVVAKIERPTSLGEIDAIIEKADGIMVARGDLGVELNLERVPTVQKMLIQQANIAEKPVITATQMLESMINEPVPTRAEVSDVANAVFDGTDALMLSAESASGKFPVACVEMMGTVIEEAEANAPLVMANKTHDGLTVYRQSLAMNRPISCALSYYESISQCAEVAARQTSAKAIVVLSYSGNMAKRIAKRKPPCPVIALTPNPAVARQLLLLRGVYPLQISQCTTADELLPLVESIVKEQGIVQEGDHVVFCAGQTSLVGVSNSLKIYDFGEALAQQQPSAKTVASCSV